MQYHAHALAASGVDVSVIGYQGAPLPKFLTDNPRISIHRFYEPRFRWRIGRSCSTLSRTSASSASLASRSRRCWL